MSYIGAGELASVLSSCGRCLPSDCCHYICDSCHYCFTVVVVTIVGLLVIGTSVCYMPKLRYGVP